jgi:hypothetical protein
MDDSPFQKLPPEIRNQIYELVLTLDQDVHLDDHRGSWKLVAETPIMLENSDSWNLVSRIPDTPKPIHPLALTKTCRAIYSESIQLFYSLNTFVFYLDRTYDAPSESYLKLDDFHGTIGDKHYSTLRQIKIDIGTFQADQYPFLHSIVPKLLGWWNVFRGLEDVERYSIRFRAAIFGDSDITLHELYLINFRDDWASLCGKMYKHLRDSISSRESGLDVTASRVRELDSLIWRLRKALRDGLVC